MTSSNVADKTFDVVIVGGGSAGAVLANRLSEDGNRRVLLLEAGTAYAPAHYPDVIANANRVGGDANHDWGYRTQDHAGLGHDVGAPRGKVLGGSSGVNAAVAMRARASDFARWAARGIEGWSFDDVLPVYKALENTPTGDDAWHGRSGPFPIRQRTMEENTPSMRAFVLASEAAGVARLDDFNGEQQNGVSPYPLNVVDGRRINTGMAYLTDAVRARPNLGILDQVEVDRVLFEGRRAVGVRLVDGRTISAGQVVLSAGAFGSPAILMRSGIGPAPHLEALDIPVLQQAPVGERLKEHPFYYNVYALKPHVKSMEPVAGAIIWTRSSEAGEDELDLHISGTHIFDPAQSPTGGAIVLACAVTLPDSVGSVRLASRDPRAMPLIRYNFFQEPRDLRRMMEAVRLSRRIGRTAPFSEAVDSEIAPGWNVQDDDALQKAVIGAVDGYAHPTSTVPMGTERDPRAVVDTDGKVRGVEGLHVVDASIMPEIPSVATNVTTIMIAEVISRRLDGRA
ncbi:GMC family oxidoreductase [Bordetella genomosp. 13]|uniref:GMC family oxidoreductase n=1 Tax=Bordetella genomosp. 13 TaxID=463040 RepID=UPI0011A93503|nr:GMC family oxidoreductase N-terminal domain-containing protein [Bordetella genomosp. 13]